MSQSAKLHKERETNTKGKRMLTLTILAGMLAILGGWAIGAQDKYTVQVPNGLAFSEFRGYEVWQVVSLS